MHLSGMNWVKIGHKNKKEKQSYQIENRRIDEGYIYYVFRRSRWNKEDSFGVYLLGFA